MALKGVGVVIIFLLLFNNYSVTEMITCHPCVCELNQGVRFADCQRRGDFQLTTVPDLLPLITKIDMKGNNLKEITERSFISSSYTSLSEVLLVQCNIRRVVTFKHLTLLTSLDLSNNFIEEIDPDTFQHNNRLKWLSVMNNRIKTLHPATFKYSFYLVTVHLSFNMIHTLPTDLFKTSKRLEIVNLHNNNLTSLNGTIFSGLSYLSKVTLHDNPWRCDCFLKQLRSNTKISTEQAPTCLTPEQFKGRSLLQLTTEDLVCFPIMSIIPNATITIAAREKVTLSCFVTQDIQPQITWMYKSENSSDFKDTESFKYHRVKEDSEGGTWLNLTISNITSSEEGIYRCANTGKCKHQDGYIHLKIKLSEPEESLFSTYSLINILILCANLILLLVLVTVVIIKAYERCRRKEAEEEDSTGWQFEQMRSGSPSTTNLTNQRYVATNNSIHYAATTVSGQYEAIPSDDATIYALPVDGQHDNRDIKHLSYESTAL